MIALVGQFGRFAVVGVVATATHVGVAMGLVESGAVAFAVANICAFAVALGVSYAGNHGWTFAARGAHGRRLPRFAILALSGLALNQLIGFVVVDLWGFDYRVALAAVVLIVPALSFAANRRWVFGERPLLVPGRPS